MAASSAQRKEVPCKMLALLVITSLFHAGVTTGQDEVVAKTLSHLGEQPRGDAIQKTTKAPETTVEAVMEKTEVPSSTHVTKTEAPETPLPARGDGPQNIPKDDVVCVSKEAVQDKNAVSLKLKSSSNCKDTKAKIQSVLQELCGEDCKLEIYQEDNSDETIVSGKYVEDDVTGMAHKFNNVNIKDKTDVEEAVPRWGRKSKLVLVSLLLAGLLLAALLTAGYYLKTHRKNSKGVRLAESFQVDEENQANTLVSVAPLPQEPVDKPTVNGESPPENGNNPAPTTNGHSQTQTPVADTEM
ncbi:hematopoietic progenitor cell antigen CD34 isoform X3 [Betta splendens]|uniref:Hematopoietic progenitor cell antigen CD34 isoform X3 n=1 Tax=Betta splendens TaxID=158456 RepID=A0A6P7MIX9_BETSP|nr:hematopoietic progenitor cell antigen CD34 isoform X3 [Betta splendens]